MRPSRSKGYPNMTTLPVALDALTAIATDPHVGTMTTKALNETGRKIPGFTDEAP